MLKLLAKKEINTLKARERQAEIDEGMKLAGKVDSLREVRADEEKALTDFRVQSVSALNAEIKPLVEQRDSLVFEVKKLKEERIEALRPITAELDELKTLSEVVAYREEAVAIQEGNVKTRYEVAVKTQKKAEENNQRAEQTLKDAQARRTEADDIKKENTRLQLEAQKAHEKAHVTLGVIEDDKKKNDESMALREKNYFARMETLEKRELEANARETRLLDREQTLARNIKRLEK